MSKLKENRERAGLTQKELSERSGVNIRTIQDYEQVRKFINKAQGLSLYNLANALNVTIEELLEL